MDQIKNMLNIKIILLSCILCLSGCKNHLLDSCVQSKDTILKKHIEYIQKDNTLTDREKRYRVRTVEEFIKLIETIENENK